MKGFLASFAVVALVAACGAQDTSSNLTSKKPQNLLLDKKARSNDLVDRYQLNQDGTLDRVMDNGRRCTVTTNVVDFKISEHPSDAAMIYFVKTDGTLYYLKNADARRDGNCPAANTAALLSDLKKEGSKYRYNVVSNTNTTIVNVALTKGWFLSAGTFLAWPNTGSPVVRETDITDYSMNECYGADGKSYKTYVAFIMNSLGQVKKIKGEKPEDSKWDLDHRYDSIQDFKKSNHVCEAQ